MSQTRTASASATYTVVDIEKVVRLVKADLMMLGDSTGACARTACRWSTRRGRWDVQRPGALRSIRHPDAVNRKAPPEGGS
jgi:hypothetical protein